jgi:hypothetical protein
MSSTHAETNCHHVQYKLCMTDDAALLAAWPRFWSKVDSSGECWNWTAAKFSNGYGILGSWPEPGKSSLAHRIAYQLARGEIPDGLRVCHRCDNRSCVRPDHLFLGTAKANTQDAKAKSRLICGTRRLSWAQVCEIRELAAAGVTGKELAVRFSVTRPTISNIKNFKDRITECAYDQRLTR